MKLIEGVEEFLAQLGFLHDVKVQEIVWRPKDRRLTVEVDDLHGNFAGLEDYQGCTPARLTFVDVEHVALAFDFQEKALKIYELIASVEAGRGIVAELKAWPGGHLQIVCGTVFLEEL